jgi:copper chaperone
MVSPGPSPWPSFSTAIPTFVYLFIGVLLIRSRAGVKEFNVSLDTQTADVTTEDSVSYETVLEKIKKTGKQVNSGEADGIEMAV